MLELRKITCQKNEIPIFEGINVKLSAGECLHIKGGNGSGKTSLLRIIAGLSDPEDGTILWTGENIKHDRETYHANMLYLGHQPPIKENLTVLENLSFMLALAGINADYEQKNRALKKIGLSDKISIPAHMLSAGQKTRLALSRLPSDNRKLWLLDEPFNSLDSVAITCLETLISDHLTNNGIVVITTHQPLKIDPGKLKVLELSV